MRPSAPPQPRRYVYTGPGEVSSLITGPPGTPVIPCDKIFINLIISLYIYNYIYIEAAREVLRLFRRSTHTDTHTLHWAGWTRKWGEGGDEKGMKMRWKWRRNEKLLNRDTKRGTQKKREGANTNTNTLGRERANPERAREKNCGGRRTRNKTSGGGEDGSAWTNLPQRNLRLPRHAQDPTYLGREGRMK